MLEPKGLWPDVLRQRGVSRPCAPGKGPFSQQKRSVAAQRGAPYSAPPSAGCRVRHLVDIFGRYRFDPHHFSAGHMLRGIRKASENWLGRTVMGVVMAVLAGSFAVWGINDIFNGFGRSTLAKIGDTEIAITQFQQTYRDRLDQITRELGKPLPPQEAAALGLDRQVLGEMVAQAGMDQRAHQMGLGIPD